MLTVYESESKTGLKRALGKRDRPVYQVTPVILVVYILYYITVAEIHRSYVCQVFQCHTIFWQFIFSKGGALH